MPLGARQSARGWNPAVNNGEEHPCPHRVYILVCGEDIKIIRHHLLVINTVGKIKQEGKGSAVGASSFQRRPRTASL